MFDHLAATGTPGRSAAAILPRLPAPFTARGRARALATRLQDWLRQSPGPGRRGWRAAAALALVGAGAYAMVEDQFSLSTEHAVVSAYTIGLRSPITGTLAALDARPGAEVAAGTPLARIEDDRTDLHRLAELRAQHGRAAAELAAAETAHEQFEALRRELAERGSAHRSVAESWYAGQIAEAQQRLHAAEARRRLTRLELERKARLQASGFAATADLDRARTEHDLALREQEAATARLAMLQTQAEGVQRGIFVDAGQSGAAYTAQRMDEVTLRLADLGRSLAALRAEADSAAGRAMLEERRIARQSQAELPAPASGVVWRLHAQPGERVAAGDLLAELTDCGSAFVLAAVPQASAARIRPGAPARLRLAGESRERRGQVTAVLGESAATRERQLAALPGQGRGSQALLRIALPPAEPGTPCLVGRSARLVVPGAGGLFGRAQAGTP